MEEITWCPPLILITVFIFLFVAGLIASISQPNISRNWPNTLINIVIFAAQFYYINKFCSEGKQGLAWGVVFIPLIVAIIIGLAMGLGFEIFFAHNNNNGDRRDDGKFHMNT